MQSSAFATAMFLAKSILIKLKKWDSRVMYGVFILNVPQPCAVNRQAREYKNPFLR